MTKLLQRRTNDPRGWLLVEVAIGGVMASAIIGALIVNTGSAMDRTTVASRQLTAMMLAQQAVEQSRAAGTTPTSSGDIGVPSGLSGRYTRTRTETAGTTTIGTNVINFKEVTVMVSFPTHDYGDKQVTLRTRIYAP